MSGGSIFAPRIAYIRCAILLLVVVLPLWLTNQHDINCFPSIHEGKSIGGKRFTYGNWKSQRFQLDINHEIYYEKQIFIPLSLYFFFIFASMSVFITFLFNYIFYQTLTVCNYHFICTENNLWPLTATFYWWWII